MKMSGSGYEPTGLWDRGRWNSQKPAQSVRTLFLALSLSFFSSAAGAATLTVNNLGNGTDLNKGDGTCEVTNGVGDCTFRAALDEANALAGADTVEFNIPGCVGVCTITNPQLPIISEQVTVDGYSQPLAQVNGSPLARVTNAILLIEIADGGTGCIDIDHLTAPTDESTGSVIKGLVISGCSGNAISMTTPYNTIQGNFLGSTADGLAVAANDNGGDGIATTFSGGDETGGNLIGGFLPEELNLISGNGGDGIDLSSNGNLVLGNIIGADALGVADLGNFNEGIRIGRDNNEIGFDLPLLGSRDLPAPVIMGNLIVGNRLNGVNITSTGDDNYLAANVIGADTFQLSALGNDDSGVRVSGTGNIIGVEAVGVHNVIAGNGEHGVLITGSGADGNTVAGNLIGITFDVLNATIYQALGNGCDGVRISTNDNTVGGSLIPGQGNYIGGNIGCGLANGPGHGISLISSAANNELLGNWIGMDPNGTPVPNAADGITVINSAADNRIGDGTEFGANLHGPTDGDLSDLAIDLGNNGRTNNDVLDGDAGPNALQNFPIVVSAISSGGSTTIDGTLNSTAGTQFLIQVFSSPAGETGQARAYEDSVTTAATNGSGDVAWQLVVSPALPAGTLITATATPDADPAPTSELSDAVAVVEPGELQFTAASFNVAEAAGTAAITVERVNGTGGAVSVDCSTADGSATQPADYTAVVGATLNWADGDGANKTCSVPIAADLLDESDETVLLSLANATGSASIGTPAAATLTIQDDDSPPQISVDDVSQAEGNAGATVFSFTVSLDAASGLPVSVTVDTSDGTATAGSDYAAITGGTVNFAAGVTTQPLTVTVNGDTTPEGNETFNVLLSSPVDATILDGQGLGTILEDDASPTFTVNDPVAVTEGNAGTTTLSFTVSLSPAAGFATSVDVATSDGTASAGADYVAVPTTTLNFGVGVTSQPVVITVNGDLLDELDETLFLNLSNASGATITDNQGTGTITDDDSPPSVSIGDLAIAEGDAGATAFDFPVMLSAPSGMTVTVDYSTADGTATTADNDYAAVAATTLTFNPGVTAQTASVVVNGDTTAEPDETFVVNLSNAANATILDGQANGDILDDDTLPLFSVDDPPVVLEGNAGTTMVTFTLSLTPAAGVTTSVDIATANGTATAGTDYVALPVTTVNFAAGVTSQPVVVTINGDLLDEVNETFFLNLTNATGGSSISDNQGVGTIGDDDNPPSVSIGDLSAVEGNAGTTAFNFPVTLSGASGKVVMVDFATSDGTATTADNDYQTAAATLTFNPGVTSQTAVVNVVGDLTSEANETFLVDLSNPQETTLSDAQGQGTIVDDDGAPQVFISDVSVNEGDAGTTNASFTLSLSIAAASTVSVDYATADGTAQAGTDYQATAGTASFTAGQTSLPVLVPVNGDLLDEVDETFVVDLSNPSGIGIADAQGQGTVVDDDPVPGISIQDLVQAEGDAGTTSFDLTVSLSAPSGKTVTVDWTTQDGTATSGSGDYQAAAGSLTFLPGTTSQVVSVLVNGDTMQENAEVFTVVLSSPVEATLTDNTGQISITNDDAVGVPGPGSTRPIPTMGEWGLMLLSLILLGLGMWRMERNRSRAH